MLAGFVLNVNLFKENSKMFNSLPQILLGFFSGLFGVMTIAIVPDTDKAIFYYTFGGFCLAICFACVFRGRVREFMGSIVGFVVFLTALWYVYSQIVEGSVASGSQSEPSIINAVLFLVVFGFPALGYVLSARFGFTKKIISKESAGVESIE
jgi:uncharacterized membrane protein HdeD (DUF308 family)